MIVYDLPLCKIDEVLSVLPVPAMFRGRFAAEQLKGTGGFPKQDPFHSNGIR
jgi:hypothetical protein